MKYSLFIFIIIVLGSCSVQNSQYKFKEHQETDLITVTTVLRQMYFNGSISIKNKEIRNSSAEIVELSIPDSVFILCNKYKITSLVAEPNFIYFTMGGFKGTNFGLLYSNIPKDSLQGFYDVEFIKRSNEEKYFWYFVSSKSW